MREKGQLQYFGFQSNKSKRVVRSVTDAEVYGVVDDFDLTFAKINDFCALFEKKMNVFMYTDSKQLFDGSTSEKPTRELRLVIYTVAGCQLYLKFDLSVVAPVCEEVSPADSKSRKMEHLRT